MTILPSLIEGELWASIFPNYAYCHNPKLGIGLTCFTLCPYRVVPHTKTPQQANTRSHSSTSSKASGQLLLFIFRSKLLFGIRKRGRRRALRLFCAFGGLPLLTAFRLSPLLFLTLEFLLALLNVMLTGPPKPGSEPV
jgi:hypothetical protein